MDIKKLNGLSQKLNALLKEYEIDDYKVEEIKLQLKSDPVLQKRRAKKCKIYFDHETQKYIMICD